MEDENDFDSIKDYLAMLAFKIIDNIYDEKLEYKITKYDRINIDNYQILDKISSITNYFLVSPFEILYKQKYEFKHKISNEKDKCSICQFELYEEVLQEFEKDLENYQKLLEVPLDVILLGNCVDHFFHIECIGNLIGNNTSFKCPNCLRIYGILTGNMPYGTFNAYKSNSPKCSGFNCDTIIINYHFPNGPGYTGTSRRSYLPNTKEGREVLALLKVAFDRKLTFTVGTSVTTGKKNTVVWNGIHHKTSVYGGPTCFGYPDNTYFNRVKEELASKGVTQESIGRDLESIAKEILKD